LGSCGPVGFEASRDRHGCPHGLAGQRMIEEHVLTGNVLTTWLLVASALDSQRQTNDDDPHTVNRAMPRASGPVAGAETSCFLGASVQLRPSDFHLHGVHLVHSVLLIFSAR
jgi:hypothetical protein